MRTRPNMACSRPAQLRKLSVIFDRWRAGRWPAADAKPLGGQALRLPVLIEDGERNVVRLSISSDQAAHE
jgi:hypothetical protein